MAAMERIVGWRRWGVGARVDASHGGLAVEIVGLDRIWAFNSGVRTPLEGVTGARVVERKDAPKTRLRWPGTYVPGLITAGSYRGGGRRSLWCVHRAQHVLVIDLMGARYDHIVLEVDDPDATATDINNAVHTKS
jgi:hypothetical protein